LCSGLLDEGSEFIFTSFRKYCEDNNIILWYSNKEQDKKNAIIERFHRTLRNYILRYEVATGKS
jgi:transposase InsO family protein